MVFSTFALLLSFLLPSTRFAGMFSGALMVFNFLLIGLSEINPDLEPFVEYTPMFYYQGGEAINGLERGWVSGLLTTALLFALLAWIPFLKRDIRVSGEHSWQFSPISLKNRIGEKIANIRKTFKKPIQKKIPDIRTEGVEKTSIKKTKHQKKTVWLVILLAALGIIAFYCAFSLIIIEAADLWCDIFAGLFNSISPGICP